MLRSPRETLALLENESDELSIDKLLERDSPFHRNFLPIYEWMVQWSEGVSFLKLTVCR